MNFQPDFSMYVDLNFRSENRIQRGARPVETFIVIYICVRITLNVILDDWSVTFEPFLGMSCFRAFFSYPSRQKRWLVGRPTLSNIITHPFGLALTGAGGLPILFIVGCIFMSAQINVIIFHFFRGKLLFLIFTFSSATGIS
jgi:hypothetical protein